MKTITISTISKDRNNVTIKLDISPELKRYFNETTFFTEYTFDITNIPNSVLVVPVLTNLLPFSWITDTVIWVNEIDQDFYNCLQVLKTGFRELHPNTQIITCNHCTPKKCKGMLTAEPPIQTILLSNLGCYNKCGKVRLNKM